VFSFSEPNYNSGTCGVCTAGSLPMLEQYCVCCVNFSGITSVVGSKLPNPLGLYDMHGNVSEWCWDRDGGYSSGSVTDPTGGADPYRGRIKRGGCFADDPYHCRAAFRYTGDESFCLGFRLVRTDTTYMPTAPPTSTPTISPTPTPTPTPPGFAYFAPGSFIMGSPLDEPCSENDATQHTVTLTRGFYMMKTEITRHMWAELKVMQPSLPRDPSDDDDSPTANHPVQSLDWAEALLFANLKSVQEGYVRCYYTDAEFTIPVDAVNYGSEPHFCDFNANGYRLPTESEWEYACRAGTTGPFSCDEQNYTSGNCMSYTSGTHPELEAHCVYRANQSGRTEIVGSKLPNPAGLFDIHGNVWEWCWDRYGVYPSGSVTDPTGPSSGSYRVKRGGYYVDRPKRCRSANRDWEYPWNGWYGLGFRLVRPDLPLVPTPILPTPTPTSTSTPTQTPITPTSTPTPFSSDDIVGDMVLVPAGTFTQGSPETEPCRNSNESQFTHTLTRDFAIMRTEVTRLMWWYLEWYQPELPEDPTDPVFGERPTHPVQSVTWYEAILFANLLSMSNGLTRCYYTDAAYSTPVDGTNYTAGSFYCNFDADGYRLPTEGEWEYACRAETDGPFSADEPDYSSMTCSDCSQTSLPVLREIAWWCGTTTQYQKAGLVGTKLQNTWGTHDMHGNVREWCWDWFAESYPAGSATDYSGDDTGWARVSRGGSWDSTAMACRSAARNSFDPEQGLWDQGFRLVRTVFQ
jgi:formylglycine-generating enzyme required for sulfatase activity